MTKLLYKRTRRGRIRVTQTHARYANFIRLSTAGRIRQKWMKRQCRRAPVHSYSLARACAPASCIYTFTTRYLRVIIAGCFIYITDRSKSSCARKLSHQPQLYSSFAQSQVYISCLSARCNSVYTKLLFDLYGRVLMDISESGECATYINIQIMEFDSHDCVVICNLREIKIWRISPNYARDNNLI